MERINFTLPESLKSEWESFAKETRKSISQMIKDAVREYRKLLKREEQPVVSPELQVLELRLEKMLEQKMQQYQELLKQPAPATEEIDNIQDMKGRILAILEDGPQPSTKLASYLGITRKQIMKVLEEMQEPDKLVKIDKGIWSVAG